MGRFSYRLGKKWQSTTPQKFELIYMAPTRLHPTLYSAGNNLEGVGSAAKQLVNAQLWQLPPPGIMVVSYFFFFTICFRSACGTSAVPSISCC